MLKCKEWLFESHRKIRTGEIYSISLLALWKLCEIWGLFWVRQPNSHSARCIWTWHGTFHSGNVYYYNRGKQIISRSMFGFACEIYPQVYSKGVRRSRSREHSARRFSHFWLLRSKGGICNMLGWPWHTYVEGSPCSSRKQGMVGRKGQQTSAAERC